MCGCISGEIVKVHVCELEIVSMHVCEQQLVCISVWESVGV